MKKLVYQITITLSTDDDFGLKKELLPPDFFNDDCREVVEFARDDYDFDFKFNIYDKDMTKSGWKDGEWGKYIAKNTFEQFISAIHVGSTHLYIWNYLLECLEELTDWIYCKEDKPDYCSAIIGGNYDGTEFFIKKV